MQDEKRNYIPCFCVLGCSTVAAPSIADCNVSAATKFSVMATDERTFITACHLKCRQVQGEPSGCSLGFVEIITKVAFFTTWASY